MVTRKSLIGVSLCAAIVAAVTGCSSKNKEDVKSKPAPLVYAVPAEKVQLIETLEATGEVVAVNAVTLEATVEGPISFCPWREGDRAEQAGQKLIEIDRPVYRQEVATAEAAFSVAQAKLADLKVGPRPEEIAQAAESVRHFEDCTAFAKADLERIRALVDSGSLPGETVEKARVDYTRCQTQLEAAKEQLAMLRAGPTVTEVAVAQAAVDEAAAKLALAQARLDECILPAPFAGVITHVLVRPGDLVTPRTPLLEMMDPSSLVVRFAVPETHIPNTHEGAEGIVELDAYPGETFQAEITRVYPELERNTRTCLAEAKVLDSAVLMPGQFARVTVKLRTIEDAIVVPDKAVLSTAQGDMVVFVVNDGKAFRKKVKAGLEETTRIQIAEGIEAGEMVILAGNENLKNGAPVKLGEHTRPTESSQAVPTETNQQETATEPSKQETPTASSSQRVSKEANKHSPGAQVLGATDVEPLLFQGRFPARLRVYDKDQVRFHTLDELCQFLRDTIEKHPIARYIATFDHYAHTAGLRDGVINPSILGAKIVIFCFGKKLDDPKMVAVRPRSIGICETETQFIISFLEAPESVPTETMEHWIRDMAQTERNGDTQSTSGGSAQ